MSQTIIAAVISIITALSPYTGFQVVDSALLNQQLMLLIGLVSNAWIIWRRSRVGDLGWLGIRK